MEKKGLTYPQSEQWFTGRISLFVQYPLPSVIAQTNQNFRWVLMMGELTPAWVVDVANRWAEKCDRIDLLFGDDFVGSYRGYIDSQERTEYLLTTRFDSDDALAPFFVSRLHAVADQMKPGPVGLNFMNGIRYVGRWVKSEQEGNPFISVLEPWEDQYRTVFVNKHGAVRNHVPVHQINGAPAWLQICHGENVVNRMTTADTPRPTETKEYLTTYFPWLRLPS